jgi:hypothetical protein
MGFFCSMAVAVRVLGEIWEIWGRIQSWETGGMGPDPSPEKRRTRGTRRLKCSEIGCAARMIWGRWGGWALP